MQRPDAETPREDEITDKVIGSAIEVHRILGPDLLESAYEECLCRELKFQRQVPLPVAYKGIKLACGYKMDLVVEDLIILSYLRLSGKSVGLLINFTSPTLKGGLKRIVNNFLETSASRRLGVEKNQVLDWKPAPRD